MNSYTFVIMWNGSIMTETEQGESQSAALIKLYQKYAGCYLIRTK